jgi:hypothetical protein
MKVIFEFDKEESIQFLEQKLRSFIRFAYGWLSTDGEVLGYILAVTHFIISAVLYLLIIACHIVYPNTTFQIGVFICIFLVWIHHMLFKVCLSVVAEKEFTSVEAPSLVLFNKILSAIGISFESFTNYFMVAETVCVIMFGLELSSKLTIFLYKNYGILY